MSFQTISPVLIKANPQDTIHYVYNDENYVLNLSESATKISDVLSAYMNSEDAEGRVYYLEGGKTYFLSDYVTVVKGFTLKTNPEDIAAGKGRAKVCLGGLAELTTYDVVDQTKHVSALTFQFMLGCQEVVEGEGLAKMDGIVFEDIDFDSPLAKNYGHQVAGKGSADHNFFINEWSNHEAVYLNSVTIRNCTFQRLIRGFMRIQGSRTTTIDNFTVDGCEFYNCGPYDRNGGGYGFVTADPLYGQGTNILRNMVWRNNTLFNTPIGHFITTNNRNMAWEDPDYKYKITIENNTFVNWNTMSSKNLLLSLRYTPNGSVITVKNNLFVQTKAKQDKRALNLNGADIRYLQGACTDKATFDFANNWSTDDHIDASTGQVFTSAPFSATTNSFGKWLTLPEAANIPNGEDGLKVHVAKISATDLMYQPNPPYWMTSSDNQTLEPESYSTESIDGKGEHSANLYFKDFDNEIVKNNVGASKWRTKQETGIKTVNREVTTSAVYNLAGQKISIPAKGVYIKNGKKYVK